MALRFVLDTNVLVAGLWSRDGAAFQILRMVQQAVIQPALSVPLVLEYEMVLRRRTAEIGLREGEVETVLNFLCSVGHLQQIHFLWRPTLRDPRDELVLELAVAAHCRYIVTHNLRDFGGVERFGVTAIRPAPFLSKLGVRP